MNKKQLAGLIEGIVSEAATKAGIEPTEAQTLVGLFLKRNRAAILESCGVTAETAPAQEPATV